MIKIRKSVFETNSSSTHSICVAHTDDYKVPKKLHFGFGEFGWERRTLRSTKQKANYLYTGLIHNKRSGDAMRVIEQVKSLGVDVTYEPPMYSEVVYNDRTYQKCNNPGWVDHGDLLTPWLDDIVNNKDHLFRYLFSELSFVITGNDHNEHDVQVNVVYPHTVWYKGN